MVAFRILRYAVVLRVGYAYAVDGEIIVVTPGQELESDAEQAGSGLLQAQSEGIIAVKIPGDGDDRSALRRQ